MRCAVCALDISVRSAIMLPPLAQGERMSWMDVITHAESILRALDIEPKALDRLLAGYLRRHRELGARERRIVSDIVFGVIRWRRRLDGCLELKGKRRINHRARILAYRGWCGGVPEYALEEMPDHFPGGAAAWHSFPDELFAIFVDRYGPEGADALADCLNEEARPCLRVNIERQSRDKALRALQAESVEAEPTARSPYGIRLERRLALKTMALYRQGVIEVQDEASQLATLTAGVRPGQTILDACAGAGGKSLMMAMLLKGRGKIIATDRDSKKLNELKRRRRRAATEMIEIDADIAKDSSGGKLPQRCDLVLVDAPCTSTGTLRRNPDLRWRITPEVVQGHARVQLELLSRYSESVAPGGRLVYMTCSLLREENEAVVEAFLKGSPFTIADAGETLKKAGVDPAGLVRPEGYFQTDPRDGDWDGFFAAVMVRKGGKKR